MLRLPTLALPYPRVIPNFFQLLLYGTFGKIKFDLFLKNFKMTMLAGLLIRGGLRGCVEQVVR